MGLDKYKKTPCGFCFVEYYLREDSEACMRFVRFIHTSVMPCQRDIEFCYFSGQTKKEKKLMALWHDALKI